MRDEVRERAHAARLVDRQHDRRAGDIGDVDEIALRVVAELGVAERQQHQLSDIAEHEIVAVGRRIGDRLHADRAAGAGASLDEELLLEFGREMVGDQAGENVGGAAGGKGVHHAHRTRRPFVGRRRGFHQRARD